MAYGNPMSQMADASKLSITQLQVALRNGTIDPQVGQLVLNSKIIADKKAKMAMQAQQPAQSPVAQQNLAYGQGVDTLPSNLPTIGAAQGGIIAFAGGDLVPGRNVTQAQIDQADIDYNAAMRDSFLNDPAIPRTVSPTVAALNWGVDKIAGLQWVRDPRTGKLVHKSDLPSAAPTHQRPEGGYFNTPAAPVYPTINNMATNPNANASPFTSPNAHAAMGELPDAPAGEVAAAQDKAPPRDRGGDRGSAFSSVKGYTPIAYDDKILKELAASELNPDTGKPYTYEEIAARNKTRGEKEGIDYGLYEKQAKELEGKKTRSNARTRLDEAMPWFAASEALGKNKSQYAMEGISAGLGAYGKSAIDIADKEEARTEGIRKEGYQLALAQNAFNQATATGNRVDLKSAEAAVKQAKMNLSAFGVETVKQQNDVLSDVFKANAQLYAAQIGADATRYSADKQGRTIDELTADILKDNLGMTRSEAKKLAYEYTMPGFGATAQRDIASRREVLQKELAGLVKSPFHKPEDITRMAHLKQQLDLLGPAGTVAAAPNTVSFNSLPK